MKWTQASEILNECEQALRKLVVEAANEGSYSDVRRLADLARAIAALAADIAPGEAIAPHRESPLIGDVSVTRSNRAELQGRRPNRRATDYPKFFRRGDELVKVGWSKKERREYSHRAPRHAIDAVVAAVRKLGANGKVFTGDKLLPLEDPSDGSRMGDYQAYVALAWLKHLGIVKQHGRKSGYSLATDKHIDSLITATWLELTEWLS